MRHPLDAAFAVLAFIIGSFLTFYGGDYASRMMKALGGSASRLHERFFKGDRTAVLALLSDLRFISEPLDPALDSTKKALNINSVCKELDKVARDQRQPRQAVPRLPAAYGGCPERVPSAR